MATRTRLTQAERRAATRTALLDAVIECIVEVGYAKTTTRMISERAGVTAGAQAHYFPNKAALVAEAVERLSAQMSEEILIHVPQGRRPTKREAERFLDSLWEMHCGPLFQAATELWAAARTDPDLRASLQRAQESITARVREGAAMVFATSPRDRAFTHTTTTVLAAIRGLAMLRPVNEDDADAMWRATRAQLVALTTA